MASDCRDLVLRRLAAGLPVSSVPVAVRRCNQCVSGGVPTPFLSRVATLPGFTQNERFTLQLAFTNLAGRSAADIFELGFPTSGIDTMIMAATGETGFGVEDPAYSNFGRYLL